MVAYIIGFKEHVRDEEEMKVYRDKARKADPGKMKYLAMFGKQQVLEGPAPEGAFILEFPTMDDALAWYHSPGYTDARQHRLKAADYRYVVVEGL